MTHIYTNVDCSLPLSAMDSSSCDKVQHVTKKSSDELLRKFAELGPENAEQERNALRVVKRRKRSLVVREGESPVTGASFLEKRRLIPPPATRKSALLRKFGVGKSRLRARARDVRNKSILVTIEKTWRKTIDGASKMLMEKQNCNRHKRLMNE